MVFTMAFTIIEFINNHLSIDVFNDYCPNGLQVQGRDQVRHVVAGVTACQALIDQAIEVSADLILVHHGYFWKNDNPVICGPLRQRLHALLKHDINLAAYHLPLDVHPLIGHNFLLGKALGLTQTKRVNVSGVDGLLSVGEFSSPVEPAQLSELIAGQLSRSPLHIDAGKEQIKSVAWCTGAAQDLLLEAASQNVDAFITGEVSERTVHLARELGIHFFAAGHHATERYGVKALGDLLVSQFDVTCQFIDIDNPV